MKRLITGFALLFCLLAQAQKMSRQQIRELLLKSLENKTALDSLHRILEATPNKTPYEESYLGICTGLYCNYDQSNWDKLRHVMKSKNLLNSAVERDSKDPELRFMRFMLEHFLPSFLGLNKHITEDLAVIFKNPQFIDDNPALKKKAIEFLLWTERCSAEQKLQLQGELAALEKKQTVSRKKETGG